MEEAGESCHQQVANGPERGHIGRFSVNFVLIEPSHPGNVGSAARALQVMGFERLTVVKPRFDNVNRHPEAVAFASGASRVLNQCLIVPTLAEAVASSRLTVAISAAGREFAPLPETPRQIGEAIKGLLNQLPNTGPDRFGPDSPAPVALVFGTERVGLSVEQAQQCGRLCSIEADPAYSSLNLSQALQIMAYEMRLALLTADSVPVPPVRPMHPDDLPAEHDRIEGMFEHLEASLYAIEYLDPAKPKRLMPRLRNLFSRAVLTNKEIDILRGICQKMTRSGTGPDKSSRND